MISVELAAQLRDAGLAWTPQAGDRFVVPGRGMDADVFVVSDMTVEVHELPQGRVIGFNGTVEWALDSVEQKDVLWLPRESQLRELLGEAFRSLDRTVTGWRVWIERGESVDMIEDRDAEQAYGLALARLLGQLNDVA